MKNLFFLLFLLMAVAGTAQTVSDVPSSNWTVSITETNQATPTVHQVLPARHALERRIASINIIGSNLLYGFTTNMVLGTNSFSGAVLGQSYSMPDLGRGYLDPSALYVILTNNGSATISCTESYWPCPPRAVFELSSDAAYIDTNGVASVSVVNQSWARPAISNLSWIVDGIQVYTNLYKLNFTSTGSHFAVLIVGNAFGSSERGTWVTVTNIPAPSALIAPSVWHTAPLGSIVFTNASTGTITNYAWYLDDVYQTNLSTGFAWTNTFVSTGKHTILLVAKNQAGSNVSKRVVWTGPESVFYTGSTLLTLSNGSATAYFTNRSSGYGVTNYVFDFGDGVTNTVTTLEDVVHSYSSVGTNTVLMSAIGVDGTGVYSAVITVTNAAPPVVAFTASARAGTNGLPVVFSGVTSGSVVSNLWRFGDGNTSWNEVATNTYLTNGTYSVSLTAYNGYGVSATATSNSLISVTNDLPTAVFTGSPRFATNAYSLVTLFDSTASRGVITQRLWSINGTALTNRDAVLRRVFRNSGSNDISLTVFNNQGSNTLTRIGYTMLTNDMPVAVFTGSNLIGSNVYSLTSMFDGTSSTGIITNWLWAINSTNVLIGSPIMSNTFTLNGSNSISLTVFNSTGSNMLTRTGYVTIIDDAPVAAFTASPRLSSNVLTLSSLLDSSASTGVITNRLWSINGVAVTNKAASFSYTFTQPTSNDVSLTVFNSTSSNALKRIGYVTISNPSLIASWTATPRVGTNSTTVAFNDASGSLVTNRFWVFGDGSTTNTLSTNLTHTYSSTGVFSAALTVFDYATSNALVRAGYISITNDVPTASFEAPATNGPAPLVVDFSASNSVGVITNYLWTFGDTTSTNTTVPAASHTYDTPGVYTVELTVSNDTGANTTTRTSYIVAE